MRIPAYDLDQWLNQYNFATRPPKNDLASSTGPHWSARDLLGLLDPDESESLLNTELTYSSANGDEELRAAVASIQGVKSSEVQITTGASEALLILFVMAAEPGANIVLPFPLFPSTAINARLLGLEVRFYHLRRENRFGIDLEEIRKLVNDRTKLLLVNSPHNPTGATISNDEMAQLHDLAAERNIQFVSDEVYHPIYHREETLSASALSHATVIGSFSKSLSLSGIRVGWIVDRNQTRLQQYTDARGYFTISNSPVAEKFALIALRHRERILACTRKVATKNLALLDQFFNEHSEYFDWVRPRGGMTAFPWLRSGDNSRKLCVALAERGVLLVPGDCFEAPDHFRLGFGGAETGFDKALQTFSDLLESGEALTMGSNAN